MIGSPVGMPVALFVLLRIRLRVSCGVGWENPLGGERLGNEACFFGELNGLGAAMSAELVEQAAGVCLDGVLADEEALGDFTVGEAGGDQAEDFEFTRGDAQFGESGGVDGERGGRGAGLD